MPECISLTSPAPWVDIRVTDEDWRDADPQLLNSSGRWRVTGVKAKWKCPVFWTI
ncbi:hypothetical protein [Castellaniella sp.]|uniref:hypothetical protein n=1 Tax=Castellaniella sp. TaxID=1955812 RepID=UPI0035610BEF